MSLPQPYGPCRATCGHGAAQPCPERHVTALESSSGNPAPWMSLPQPYRLTWPWCSPAMSRATRDCPRVVQWQPCSVDESAPDLQALQGHVWPWCSPAMSRATRDCPRVVQWQPCSVDESAPALQAHVALVQPSHVQSDT
ncbi:hypothetical protein NDU88_007052 [Pleurodeles waltl]|uniref:Uncharacterized protein n=1 Tax=Pleurodeles waltl TaxID=8319 RepID=A0AAV7WHE5_PLEWA|nr:hypothetical protein NDU88_007052 [Pleurodeles waltl]